MVNKWVLIWFLQTLTTWGLQLINLHNFQKIMDVSISPIIYIIHILDVNKLAPYKTPLMTQLKTLLFFFESFSLDKFL